MAWSGGSPLLVYMVLRLFNCQLPLCNYAASNTANPRSRYSSTLLHPLLPDFYYLQASVFSESSLGYVNWPRPRAHNAPNLKLTPTHRLYLKCGLPIGSAGVSQNGKYRQLSTTICEQTLPGGLGTHEKRPSQAVGQRTVRPLCCGSAGTWGDTLMPSGTARFGLRS